MNERTRSYQGYKRLSSQKQGMKISKIVTTLHLSQNKTNHSTDTSQRFYSFEKKNSVSNNITRSFMKKDSLTIGTRNYLNQSLSNQDIINTTTPKHNFEKAKSRVSLLGQYTSSAMIAKAKQSKPNLNRTKPNISYLSKGSNYSMYPLNISTCTNTVQEYKGQTMNLKTMYDIDKRLRSPQPLNSTLKPMLKHSSTAKCLQESIGGMMRS